MTYDFERQKCRKCGKINFCVLHDLDWYCQDCFCWLLGYADKKDKINLLFSKIPDIEI